MYNQYLHHEHVIFTHVHPTVIRGVIIQFGADGRDESAPTPTECTLQLFMYNQYLHHEHVIFTHVHQRLHHVHPL